MHLLDTEIVGASALVIDGNPTSRSVLAAMLRDFGVEEVVQASRPQDARVLLEQRRFDIVVCEYHFEGEPVSGQDLLDDLRLARVLPLATVVVVISGEASYVHVAEAAEAALDAYLIKPHTEAALRDRLVKARERKRALRDIIATVEQSDFIDAAELCEFRVKTHGAAWMHAARIGSELWLRLGKPHAAQKLYDIVLQTGALPWARLGLARSQYEAGGVAQARRTLESLLNEQPGYVDAYDVMGRVLLDQGEPEQALDALRRATKLTPGSVARLVKHGLLAFYYGDPKEAEEILARATRLGLKSRVFDLQGLVLLAMLQYDRGDRRGLAQSLRSIAAARLPHQGSARLRRFEQVVSVFQALLDRRVAEAMDMVRTLIEELVAPDFEFEAACNLLSVLARMHGKELRIAEIEHDVGKLAGRFAVSRVTCSLLGQAAQRHPEFERIVQDTYQAICDQAEEAVSHTLNGSPTEAVRLLLNKAEVSLNAKLIDLAGRTLERHHARIEDLHALRLRAQALNERYRSYGTQVHLGGTAEQHGRIGT